MLSNEWLRLVDNNEPTIRATFIDSKVNSGANSYCSDHIKEEASRQLRNMSQ